MKELLVPAGDMESLCVAIKAGADAVYLAGKNYSARKRATNFSNEEILEAVKLCHLYGVKIYVTVNVLIYESEFKSVLDYVLFLYKAGVDALIIQDLGLISFLRNYLPDLEIHASTQVHNTNKDTIAFLSELGVKRVVLARELSVSEINVLGTDLEIEAFVHGALCVSYSGQCLFSSMLLQRSGNRGECAQMCRLPYKLYCENDKIATEGNYLLSPREFNTAASFEQLMKSNIYSFKIEGRLKSPEYIGCVTKIYRSLIDEYERYGTCTLSKEMLDDISLIYNRLFTKGFLFEESFSNLMNIKTSNHQGVFLGTVTGVLKRFVKVKLDCDLKQGDGIRFLAANEGMILNYIYDLKGNLISGAKRGEEVLLDRRFSIQVGEKINKTFSVEVRDKYLNLGYPRIPISMRFKALANEQLVLTVCDGENTVEEKYGMALAAINRPTSREQIIKQLVKLGNTPFSLKDIDVCMSDNLFINIKDINEIRRIATAALTRIRENKNARDNINIDTYYKSCYSRDYVDKCLISVLVRKEEQLKYLLDKVHRIYVPDKALYLKYRDYGNVYYRTNRVKDDYVEEALVTQLGCIKNGGIADSFLNVTNHETINILSKYVDIVTLSLELDDKQIKRIMDYYKQKCNVEMVIYGRAELMLMKYCPLKYLINKDNVCHVCRNGKQYYLGSESNNHEKKFPIITNVVDHTTTILNHEVLDKIERIPVYKEWGVRNFRIELFDEDKNEINKILSDVRRMLC